MTVLEKLDEIARELDLAGDDKARELAKRFGAWAVREAAGQASISDYDRETVEKRLAWLVGEIEK